MKRFEVINFGSDFGIKSIGKNQEELFSNIAYGMFCAMQDCIFEVDTDNAKEVETISIKSENIDDLLISFLNELLYRSELNNRAYGAFSYIKSNPKEITVLCYWSPIKKIKKNIKAANYRKLKIKKNKDNFEARVTFDL